MRREGGHRSWEESWTRGDKMGIPAAGGQDPTFPRFAGTGWAGVHTAASPVLGWGEARRAAAAVAGQRLHGGTRVVVAEGQEAASGARVQHAGAVEEGEAALGQGSLEGTEGGLSAGSTWLGDVPSPALGSLLCRMSVPWQISSAPASDPDLPPSFAESLGVTYSFQGDRGPPPPRPTHTRTSQGRGCHYLSVPTSLPRAPCLCRRQWRRLSSEASEQVGR